MTKQVNATLIHYSEGAFNIANRLTNEKITTHNLQFSVMSGRTIYHQFKFTPDAMIVYDTLSTNGGT